MRIFYLTQLIFLQLRFIRVYHETAKKSKRVLYLILIKLKRFENGAKI